MRGFHSLRFTEIAVCCRNAVSLNGKRPLDTETVMEHENNDLSSSKRPKTQTVSNGVDYSSTTQPSKSLQSNPANAIHNGFVEAAKPVDSDSMSTAAPVDNVSETHNRNNGIADNSMISESAKLTNPKPIDNKSDLTTIKQETSQKQQLAAVEQHTRPIKELKDDSQTSGEPEIITLSDSEDEFQEVNLLNNNCHPLHVLLCVTTCLRVL